MYLNPFHLDIRYSNYIRKLGFVLYFMYLISNKVIQPGGLFSDKMNKNSICHLAILTGKVLTSAYHVPKFSFVRYAWHDNNPPLITAFLAGINWGFVLVCWEYRPHYKLALWTVHLIISYAMICRNLVFAVQTVDAIHNAGEPESATLTCAFLKLLFGHRGFAWN